LLQVLDKINSFSWWSNWSHSWSELTYVVHWKIKVNFYEITIGCIIVTCHSSICKIKKTPQFQIAWLQCWSTTQFWITVKTVIQ
jgi:hypothetical protein